MERLALLARIARGAYVARRAHALAQGPHVAELALAIGVDAARIALASRGAHPGGGDLGKTGSASTALALRSAETERSRFARSTRLVDIAIAAIAIGPDDAGRAEISART